MDKHAAAELYVNNYLIERDEALGVDDPGEDERKESARDIVAGVLRHLSALPAEDAGWRPTHRHVKRGSMYQYVGPGVLQTAAPVGDDLAVAIYRGEDGRLWVRPALEFADGRFEPLPTPPVKP